MTDDKAAELLAAVRAVESGERSAASFFTQPEPPRETARAPRRPAPAPSAVAAPGGGGEGGGPVAVPEGVTELLAGAGAPQGLAPRLVEALGEQAAQVLRADPWQLLAARGVQPEQADGFARALLGSDCGPGDERRTQALVGWLLERAGRSGHTVLKPAALAEELSALSVPEPDEAVRGAVDTGAVLVFEDALDAAPGSGTGEAGPPRSGPDSGTGEEAGGAEQPADLLVGLDRYALAEESLADGLARLVTTCVPPVGEAAGPGETGGPGASANEDGEGGAGPGETVPPSPSAGAWETAAEAAPSPSAAELIRAVAGHGLVVHTGGEAARAEPAALVSAARGLGLRAYAAAHSAEGRGRLGGMITPGEGEAAVTTASGTSDGPSAVGGPAVTVAGLLAGREGPARDEDGAWALDVLAVCDAPQLDAETAAALVEQLPDGARLVLSGDPLLLGPAGPGQVFGDVLAARACPHLASRTPDPGPLGELVSGIGIGELEQVEAPGKEVVIVPVRDAGEAVHRTVQLVADSVPRAIGVPADRTQVITPGHGGAAGTRALNAALKERLNPGQGRFGGFDPGDRVAHSPVPGRTALGTVVSGDEKGLGIEYTDTGEHVLVAPDRVPETVRHGWAVTAHQAVGTRWPAVVVVLPGDATGALSREWVYTAFGRAEQHLSVVHGAEDALPRAVSSVTAPARGTRLRPLLTAAVHAATAPAAPTAAPADTDAPQEP